MCKESTWLIRAKNKYPKTSLYEHVLKALAIQASTKSILQVQTRFSRLYSQNNGVL